MYGWAGPLEPGNPLFAGSGSAPTIDDLWAAQTPADLATAHQYGFDAPVDSGQWEYPIGGPVAAPSFTSWLNQNAGKVALGVGGVFALMLFGKAGR